MYSGSWSSVDRFAGCWGYLDQSDNNEYAYLGTTFGLAVLKITDPYNIVYRRTLASPRHAGEVKIYDHYLYYSSIYSDLLIYDIEDPDYGPDFPQYIGKIDVGGSSDIKKIHDIYIADGVLYLACLDNYESGTRYPNIFMYDLRNGNAANPVRIGEWKIPYHVPWLSNHKMTTESETKAQAPSIGEVWVKDRRIYCAGGTSGIIVATFWDSTSQHRKIRNDSTWVITYQMLRDTTMSPGFEKYRLTHTVKATDDHHYIFVCDEVLSDGNKPPTNNQGGVLRMFDISNIETFLPISKDPAVFGPYEHLEPLILYEVAENATEGEIIFSNNDLIYPNTPVNSIHKVYLDDNYAYIAYYTKGLRILDISNPLNWKKAGYFDTWATTTGPHSWFAGSFSVFPFFDSGTIIAADQDRIITFHFKELSGLITEDTRLSGIVIITGNTAVDESVTLTIDPGTVIKFEDDVSLTVNGTLNAQGTVSDSIKFLSVNANPAPQDWYSIIVDGSDASINMDYCSIKYASRGLKFTDDAKGSVSNSTIRYTKYGMYIYSSEPIIQNCDISDNESGLRIYYSYSQDWEHVQIENTNVSNNSKPGIFLFNSSPSISGSEFDSNKWGVQIRYSSYPIFYNCDISNSTYYGILCADQSSPDFWYHLGYEFGGYNIIGDNGSEGVLISGSSSPNFGPEPDVGGNNSFLDNTGYEMDNNTSSSVFARENWWAVHQVPDQILTVQLYGLHS